jgi:hypothetical protein
MKNILKRLQSSSFISGIHDKLLTAEAIRFIETAGLQSKPFTEHICIKHRSISETEYLDSFIKFNLMATGLAQYLKKLDSDDAEGLMVNCNIDDRILLVAYKNEDDTRYISKLNFYEMGLLPIHSTSIDLDYNNKVHILLYNKKIGFPEIIMN